MKKLYCILSFICATLPAVAQVRLSGKIISINNADTLYINVPVIFGFNHDNDVAIPVTAAGDFNTLLNIKQQKFGNIRFGDRTVSLLLTPDKSLYINYNATNGSLSFKGLAAPENALLNKLDINSRPFFAKDAEDNPYAKLSLAELQQLVVKPWATIRDDRVALVQRSPLSAADKKLIIQEINANYILQLNYFARGIMDRSNKRQITDFILSAYAGQSLSPGSLPAGPQYFQFADSFIGYYESLAFHDLTDDEVKNPQTQLKYYDLTIDSGSRLAAKNGKAFLSWILVKNNFPGNIAERWLVQTVLNKCSSKELLQSKALMAELILNYPQSGYLPELKNKVRIMETALAQNQNNKAIIIAPDYDKLKSISQVIEKLKGKVVYLDIWGTWCGPCKEEILYNPQLKHYFKDKDVAFVYLDMDDDEKDGQWRDFIKVNGMTGLHLRKNRTEIEHFWNELVPKATDARYYPMYFIFDKNGKLVQANAKRPSDKKQLYKQIEQYL